MSPTNNLKSGWYFIVVVLVFVFVVVVVVVVVVVINPTETLTGVP